ncbi:hypothetical protein PILCRDRAFT_728685 [Piloderma croceum F 1598]|uniref:Uncharacterized protein n=1 Tax=Piloderma croceum (strain F 1598) TaxID=765440 RepID=A0A0C3AHU5_PILCF|nr:hypothetical protein PILCRDRAFT_728685 [Piloderma croceum F 1598]
MSLHSPPDLAHCLLSSSGAGAAATKAAKMKKMTRVAVKMRIVDYVRDYRNEVDENLSFMANWLSLDRVGKERVERKRVQPRVLRALRCERFILRVLLYHLLIT